MAIHCRLFRRTDEIIPVGHFQCVEQRATSDVCTSESSKNARKHGSACRSCSDAPEKLSYVFLHRVTACVLVEVAPELTTDTVHLLNLICAGRPCATFDETAPTDRRVVRVVVEEALEVVSVTFHKFLTYNRFRYSRHRLFISPLQLQYSWARLSSRTFPCLFVLSSAAVDRVRVDSSARSVQVPAEQRAVRLWPDRILGFTPRHLT